MEREIKFRSIVRFANGKFETYIMHPFNSDLNTEGGDLMLPSRAELLGVGSQFTGLKDKNGKEIYEGDIVKTFTQHNCQIVFDNGGFKYQLTDKTKRPFFHSIAKESEVIGNIHQNPELL